MARVTIKGAGLLRDALAGMQRRMERAVEQAVEEAARKMMEDMGMGGIPVDVTPRDRAVSSLLEQAKSHRDEANKLTSEACSLHDATKAEHDQKITEVQTLHARANALNAAADSLEKGAQLIKES